MNAARRLLCRLFVAFVLFGWIGGVAHAQPSERKQLDAWARESWTQRAGLPNDQVNALAQSNDGYLWIGTPDGLARFNGNEFAYNDRGSVPELHDNDIRHLAIGRENSLLISTARGGLSFLHQGYWTVAAGTDGGLSQDTVVAAQEDSRGRLWVATATGGLDLFDGHRKLHFGSRNGLPSDRMSSLLVMHDDSVWVGTSAGLARIVDERVQTISVSGGLLPSGAVSALAEAQDHSLWVGTQVGAFRQLYGGHQFEKMTPDAFDDVVLAILPDSASEAFVGTAQHGLLLIRDGRYEPIPGENPGHAWQVGALLRGDDGSIWVGGNQGLLRLRDTPFSAFGKEQGLSNENVHGVLETQDGDVWIGTHGGLERLHKGQLSRIVDDGLATQTVLALTQANDGGLWVGTEKNGVLHVAHGHVDRVLDRQSAPSDWVRSILEEADGSLWIATNKGLVQQARNTSRVYTTADGLPNDVILGVHRDPAGRLWIGTANGLAYRSGGRFVRVPLSVHSMVQTIYGFADDADGSVWIASDRGLLRWKDDRVSVLASEQGLPVDTVYAVVPDRQGNLWLTTPSGLVRIGRAQASAVADGKLHNVVADLFGESDGLPSSRCNGGSSPAASLLTDGSVWVATPRGIAQVHPERLADYRSGPPQTMLEEIRVDDRVVVANEALELGPDTRKLDVRFFALNYHLPKRIQYRYLLEGYDSAWSEIGEHTSVQFTNLPAGDYRLRIQATVVGGSWSPREAGLQFSIGAHLWRKAWFDVSMAALLLAGGWLAYVNRIRSIAANERRLRLLVDARTEDLRLQTEKLRRTDAEKSELLELLRVKSEAFERQAREDALTGLANRRRVDEAIEAYFSESKRSGRPLGFTLMDIDFFKRINDRFSHATGDAVLRELGSILRQHQRPGDLAARLGGEEFICVLAGSDLPGARTFCERIRLAIEGHDWEAIAPGLRVTVSMGVVVWNGEESYSRMASRADELLYRAKSGGRNRVEG
ncbi:MAG TPA: two-component regulator propeller domain-containing protein [Xanthomonadaceae bacterium]|nr:two-component regulator propeller domain-containing protein [Xanthomonadaceae bacterium]